MATKVVTVVKQTNIIHITGPVHIAGASALAQADPGEAAGRRIESGEPSPSTPEAPKRMLAKMFVCSVVTALIRKMIGVVRS